jgi:hypothetical protein
VKELVAQDIVSYYYQQFVDWGFKSKCGIIATKKMAKLIGWPKQASYMPLWLEGEMDETIAPKEEVLTPSYFKLDDLVNKGYNAEEDKDKVQQALTDMKTQFKVSSNSDSSASLGSVDSNVPSLKKGQSLEIPNGLGGSFTITMYGKQGWYFQSRGWVKVASGTGQERVHNKWVSAGCAYDDGVAVLNGYALIATTTTFGHPGDAVYVEFSNGYKMNAVIADTKSSSDSGCNKWGHDNGATVVEFEVSKDYYFKYGNPGGKYWTRIKGARVTKITNYGKYC